MGAPGPAGAPGVGLPTSCVSGDAAVFYGGTWTCTSQLPRYVVNGDGTLTDNQTGLMWELQTSTCTGEITCYSNTYVWSASGTAADGTLFTQFLATLNGGDYYSPSAALIVNVLPASCFANHCDWRIPSIGELYAIVGPAAPPGCGFGPPCIDPAFGPTQAGGYWSSSSIAANSLYGNTSSAWAVNFFDGAIGYNDFHFLDYKYSSYGARAVRSSSR